jgi:hypothetical protein
MLKNVRARDVHTRRRSFKTRPGTKSKQVKYKITTTGIRCVRRRMARQSYPNPGEMRQPQHTVLSRFLCWQVAAARGKVSCLMVSLCGFSLSQICKLEVY